MTFRFSIRNIPMCLHSKLNSSTVLAIPLVLQNKLISPYIGRTNITVAILKSLALPTTWGFPGITWLPLCHCLTSGNSPETPEAFSPSILYAISLAFPRLSFYFRCIARCDPFLLNLLDRTNLVFRAINLILRHGSYPSMFFSIAALTNCGLLWWQINQ